jgi:hypothetical protein
MIKLGDWGVGRCLACGQQNEMRVAGPKGTHAQAKCRCARVHTKFHPSYITHCRCRKGLTTHEQLTPLDSENGG